MKRIYLIPLCLLSTILCASQASASDWIEQRKQYYSIINPGIDSILSEGKCAHVNQAAFGNWNSDLKLKEIAGADKIGSAELYIETLAATCNPNLAKEFSLNLKGKESLEQYNSIHEKITSGILNLIEQSSCTTKFVNTDDAYSVASLALKGEVNIDIFLEALKGNCHTSYSVDFAKDKENGREKIKIYNQTSKCHFNWPPK